MYCEERDPNRGLDGIFECFSQRSDGIQDVVLAHIHEHFELLYCTSGKYEMVIDKQTMELSIGDIVLIRPMQLHQTRTLHDGINQYTVLKFVPEGLFSSMQPIYEMKYIFPFMHPGGEEIEFYTQAQLAGSNIHSLLQCLLDESADRSYGYEMAMRTYTELVLLWFIRQWHLRSDIGQIDEDSLRRIKAIFQYISEHIDEPLTVERIGKRFNMGRSTLSRFFNRYIQQSVPAYVRRLRLTKAANLLIQTEKNITEIAFETGFTSTSYFIQNFREQNGITPKQFRHLSRQS